MLITRLGIISGLIWVTMVGLPVRAQPDLNGWERLVRSMAQEAWVDELESLEPGAVLAPLQPDLEPSRWWTRSEWAEMLVRQLELLPMASHHADRVLQRLLSDGMLVFRLMEYSTDRHRARVETAFAGAGLPVEWALLPMALTGWNNAYYGPGRRAGPWAMDVPSALTHGLDIRRGWDERHLPERMDRAAVARAMLVTQAFPEDPLRQVIAFTRGPQAAERFDPESQDAEWLEWAHLLRVILQVDRNFDRDGTDALWILRERDLRTYVCPTSTPWLLFSAVSEDPRAIQTLKKENPWYTLDSVGLHPLRPHLFVPPSIADQLTPPSEACGIRRKEGVALPSVSHTVRAGEVLGTIARDHGVRIEVIRRANDLQDDLIKVGQVLSIPGGLTLAERAEERPDRAGTSEGTWIWHTVREGESYWTISQLYPQASLQDLLEMNDTPPESLRPGMRLRIPPP